MVKFRNWKFCQKSLENMKYTIYIEVRNANKTLKYIDSNGNVLTLKAGFMQMSENQLEKCRFCTNRMEI